MKEFWDQPITYRLAAWFAVGWLVGELVQAVLRS